MIAGSSIKLFLLCYLTPSLFARPFLYLSFLIIIAFYNSESSFNGIFLAVRGDGLNSMFDLREPSSALLILWPNVFFSDLFYGILIEGTTPFLFSSFFSVLNGDLAAGLFSALFFGDFTPDPNENILRRVSLSVDSTLQSSSLIPESIWFPFSADCSFSYSFSFSSASFFALISSSSFYFRTRAASSSAIF